MPHSEVWRQGGQGKAGVNRSRAARQEAAPSNAACAGRHADDAYRPTRRAAGPKRSAFMGVALQGATPRCGRLHTGGNSRSLPDRAHTLQFFLHCIPTLPNPTTTHLPLCLSTLAHMQPIHLPTCLSSFFPPTYTLATPRQDGGRQAQLTLPLLPSYYRLLSAGGRTAGCNSGRNSAARGHSGRGEGRKKAGRKTSR